MSNQDSFCEIVDDWKAKLSGAFDLCMPHKTPQAERVQGAWIAEKNVPVSAYRPSAWPYFLSYDRGTMHSWWTDTQQKVHLKLPGVPLMQFIRMPPRGHDLHQLVEHAIGAANGHVGKVLGKASV